MANWLTFEKVKAWSATPLRLFQYDSVPDELISRALADTVVLDHVDTSLDWEDDRWLRACQAVPDEHKHAYRVAALVRELRAGGKLRRPILIDTFMLGRCGCGIDNGHHRIRALQYLGVPCGPFGLSGYLGPLEELVRLAGTKVPGEFAHFFSPQLLEAQPDDVVLEESAHP
jgi:hypothetical protein